LCLGKNKNIAETVAKTLAMQYIPGSDLKATNPAIVAITIKNATNKPVTH
jgi:hypothetical protein